MKNPELSVVMSVYNGEQELEKTINSVLMQKGVEFEFIIVNDGSTDNSENIIREKMSIDPRIILINQANLGLTRALIVGCNAANGQYIARQDVGDVSLADRFQNQLTIIKRKPSVSMISTGVSFIDPDGIEVYNVIQSEQQARDCFKSLASKHVYGPPHHGSVIFSKRTYELVGGYRKEFSVAQDLDLWSRLVEIGYHYSTTEIYYQAGLRPGSISSTKRDQQQLAVDLIVEMCCQRQYGLSDADLLSSVEKQLNVKPSVFHERRNISNYYYFLGANLRIDNYKLAEKYFKLSIKKNPFNLKAWVRLIFKSL